MDTSPHEEEKENRDGEGEEVLYSEVLIDCVGQRVVCALFSP